MKGKYWVRIGEYITPKPFFTSEEDRFMAKQTFNIFFEDMKLNIMRDDLPSLKGNDPVLVVHDDANINIAFRKRKVYFKGFLDEAIKWAKDEKAKT